MAMTANWVHTKYEMRATLVRKQGYIDKKFMVEPAAEKQKLVFDVTDTGSYVNGI